MKGNQNDEVVSREQRLESGWSFVVILAQAYSFLLLLDAPMLIWAMSWLGVWVLAATMFAWRRGQEAERG